MTSKKESSLNHELDIKDVKPGSSWGSVFSAAASVKLEALDDDFLARTQCNATPLASIAELARSVTIKRNRERNEEEDHQKMTKKPKIMEAEDVANTVPRGEDANAGSSKNDRKKTKKAKRAHKGTSAEKVDSADVEITSDSPVLEGRMVPHPDKDEQIMVLLDNRKKVVYSALRKTDCGDLIAVGRLRSSGKIKWNSDAFDTDTNDDNDTTETTFPFPADPDDHCESPLAAYRDVLPLLEFLFPKKERCKIYDPYYCDGAVKRNLASLGFPQVHNVKEDCYQTWASRSVPDLDVLITNPPYSQDHIPKLVDFLSSPTMTSKPWFLLMPQWVSKKPYFVEKWDKKAFFIVPNKRYVYVPPKAFREKKASDVHKKSSPFVTIWFVWGGSTEKTALLYDCCLRNMQSNQYELARSKNGLRDLRRKNQRN